MELGSKCQKRLEQLETDLKMRRKVHIHEIEERKNLHINDLIRNDKAFGQMKQYYNTITSDNLKLITSLKRRSRTCARRRNKIRHHQGRERRERQAAREPPTVAVAEVAALRARLRDRDKDKLAPKLAEPHEGLGR